MIKKVFTILPANNERPRTIGRLFETLKQWSRFDLAHITTVNTIILYTVLDKSTYTEIMKSVATIKLKFNFENERSYNIFECEKPLSFLTIYDLPHSITTYKSYNIVSIEWEKRLNVAVAERKRRYKENITSVVALEHDAIYMNIEHVWYKISI